MTIKNIPIRIFDSELNFIAEVDDYEYLRWHFKWRQVDEFEFKINRYKKYAEEIQVGRIIAIYRYGEWRGGIIEETQIQLSEEGKASETLEVKGRSLDGLTLERLCLHDTTSGDGYDTQTGNAETIMKHYVDVNMVNAIDTDRNISLLEIEADQGRGATYTARGRFQTVAEILEEIALYSGLGWGITLDLDNKKFVFKVYEGLDRSFGNDVNSPVVFNPLFENVRILTFKNSRLDSKNVLYIAGQGEGADRNIQKVTKDGQTYQSLIRREFFQDARDIDNSLDLIARGQATLAEIGEETIFEVENLETGPFVYGTDFKIGDIVTIEYPDVASADVRIVEVIEDIDDNGISQKLIFGKKFPDLKSGIRTAINVSKRDIEFDPDKYVEKAGSLSDISVRDHHLLTGLSDDDHPQYYKQSGDSRDLTVGGNLNVSGSLSVSGEPVFFVATLNEISNPSDYRVRIWPVDSNGGFTLTDSNTRVVIPVTGIYILYAQQLLQSSNTHYYCIKINDSTVVYAYKPSSITEHYDMVASTIRKLYQGDNVSIYITGTVTNKIWGDLHSAFYIVKIQ